VTVEQQIRWALGLVLAAILVIVGISYWNTVELTQSEQLVQHTQEVGKEIETLLVAVVDSETGARGFVITSSEAFLEPASRAERAVPAHIARLRELTADYAVQLQRIATLQGLITKRFDFNRRIVSIRRAQGLDATTSLVASGEGKVLTDGIRSVLADMRTEEESRLSERQQTAQSHAQAARYIGVVLVVLLLTAISAFFTVIRRDIAARARTMEALEHSENTLRAFAQQLERSNRDLQDFAMVASHDLQEPLRKIRMFGDRLKEECGATLPAHGRDYLERMQNAAARGQALIEGLLAYSRVTTKAQPPVPIALDAVAREVVGDLEGRITAVGGRVEIGRLPTIEADPLQMRQLLQNLIGNALKFHREGESALVRVEARRALGGEVPIGEAGANGEMWTLSVADNGVGFDEKYLDRIFKLFQRLHERGVYDGAGMGLAICRKIVERHNGTITATSTPGRGATFLVTLPAKQPRRETLG
jgi:signal transduction histidine kinase